MLAWIRVVVVEDEAVFALTSRACRGLGCVVLPSAPPVAGALALLRTERPDVAPLNVGLADGRAPPVAAALAAAGVPSVLVTGYAGAEFAEPVPRSAPHLGKPCGLGDPQRTIRRLLREREVRARARHPGARGAPEGGVERLAAASRGRKPAGCDGFASFVGMQQGPSGRAISGGSRRTSSSPCSRTNAG